MLGFLVFLCYLFFWMSAVRQGCRDIVRGELSHFSVWRKPLLWGLFGTVLFLVLDYLFGFYVKQYLWFNELGYLNVLWTTYSAYWGLMLVAGVLVWIYLRISFGIAVAVFPSVGSEMQIREATRFEYGRIKPTIEDLQQTRHRLNSVFKRWVIPWISAALGIGIAQSEWQMVLLYLNQVSTGTSDLVFNKDLSFWLFTLPIYQSLLEWLWIVFSFSLAVVFIYILVVDKGFRWVPEVLAQKSKSFWKIGMVFAAKLSFLIGATLWLYRYLLLYSTNGAAYGAGYTDINVRLPIVTALTGLCALAALYYLMCGFGNQRRWGVVVSFSSFLVASLLLGGMVYPAIFQSLSVRPDELRKEEQYIARTINTTRLAYGISDRIEEKEFVGKALTLNHQKDYPTALKNVRLWDWRAAKPIYEQQQSLRRYYSFLDTDVDRYVVGGTLRQVMLAARELNPDNIPEKTWVNQRLKYTHGYGVFLHFGNTKTVEGYPEFVVGDIPPYGPPEFQITRPEIYFGEMTTNEILVRTKEKEFDYSSGDKNIETVYQGRAGVPIGFGLRRFAIAWNFDGWALWSSPLVTKDSRFLFTREITSRVKKIAPFLVLDRDPYLVIRGDGSLVWIIDAYTVSGYWPYSEPQGFNGQDVSYVRNSVKVVVDAYNGKVDFFVADNKDPIILTWQSIFPGMLKPLENMPADLRAHLRYGEDFFKLQARVLLAYHMIDPKVFYNKEDLWSVAQEQYEDNRQDVEPYYVITQIEGGMKEETMLILPFTPYSTSKTRKENLMGWMAARVDGENYGKLLLYKFPKGILRYGPMQVESSIDQNGEMSAQITLWNQSGSKVVRGNLLVIPVGDAIFYAEPLYVKSTTLPMPQLRKVILATQRSTAGERDAKLNLVWADTFEESLGKLFGTLDSGAVSVDSGSVPGDMLTNDTLRRVKEHLERYREYNARGEFGRAGAELQAIMELFKAKKLSKDK